MAQEVRKMTFAMIRELIGQEQAANRQLPFLGDEFALVYATPSMIGQVLRLRQALRIDELRCALVRKGQARVTINLIEKDICEGMVVLVTPGSILQPIELSPDFSIEAMGVSPDLARVILGGTLPESLIHQMTDVQMLPDAAEGELLSRLFGCMWLCLRDRQQPRREVLLPLIAACLRHFDTMIQRRRQTETTGKGSRQDVFNRFIRLVNKHAHHEHRLSFYAQQLCMTERYLSTLVKQASGDSAKQWIDRAIMTEAKVLLRTTDRTVNQIADDLKFPNTSFFCKYFKRMSGITPQAYRAMK